MWFQQDGAKCHTAQETIQLLHESFPGRLIYRFDNQNWPLRSTPLDFFLWVFLKSKVYANKPTTTQALKGEIEKISFDKRVCIYQESRGGHLNDMLFHT